MKFNCGPTHHEKIKAKERWHRWFAWRPVQVAGHDCRWLEYVERRGSRIPFAIPKMPNWRWQYRALR